MPITAGQLNNPSWSALSSIFIRGFPGTLGFGQRDHEFCLKLQRPYTLNLIYNGRTFGIILLSMRAGYKIFGWANSTMAAEGDCGSYQKIISAGSATEARAYKLVHASPHPV